jgi:hypothetical protein
MPSSADKSRETRSRPMSQLVRITMHLARTHDYPNGSPVHGYSFVAPIDGNDRIDLEAWRSERKACTVERFWGRELPKSGFLVHRPGGVDGATWGFDYDARTHADDEAGFRFGDHAFRPGEYVSIREADGETLTFRIVDMEPA